MTKGQINLVEKLKADRGDYEKLLALKKQLDVLTTKVDVGAINYESDGSTPERNENSVEKKIHNYIEDKDKLIEEINTLNNKELKNIIAKKKLFDNLTSSRLYAIMSMTFINFMTNEQIAEAMKCDVSTVQRNRKKALNILLKMPLYATLNV